MRTLPLIAFLVLPIGLLLSGCQTETSHHSSIVFNALNQLDREALIRTNALLPHVSFDHMGSGFCDRGHSEWSDRRMHFEVPTSKADIVFQVYHDKIKEVLLKHADHVYGGEVLSNANFRRFIFDYESGRHAGNFSAYSFISANGEMWIADLLYDH